MATSAPSAVEEALGGSIIAEELKGEPGRASVFAEETLTDARARGDALALGPALVDRGLALLIGGLPGAAQACFAEAAEIGGPEVALLAIVYDRLASTMRFNALPDGQGAGSAAARGTAVSRRPTHATVRPRRRAVAGAARARIAVVPRPLALGPFARARLLERST